HLLRPGPELPLPPASQPQRGPQPQLVLQPPRGQARQQGPGPAGDRPGSRPQGMGAAIPPDQQPGTRRTRLHHVTDSLRIRPGRQLPGAADGHAVARPNDGPIQLASPPRLTLTPPPPRSDARSRPPDQLREVLGGLDLAARNRARTRTSVPLVRGNGTVHTHLIPSRERR